MVILVYKLLKSEWMMPVILYTRRKHKQLIFLYIIHIHRFGMAWVIGWVSTMYGIRMELRLVCRSCIKRLFEDDHDNTFFSIVGNLDSNYGF